MRTTCCLNLPPPPTSNPSLNTCIPVKPPPQLPLVKDEGSWRSQCIMMKMACTLIGLQLGNSVTAPETEFALALHLPVPAAAAAKWSEKRACPSWRHNSWETVVPENLPRPAARRRWIISTKVCSIHSN
ncbi:uncharacterized protein LOC114735699 isoform X2 [Neltuma alba]|uniref:uncharacterized protein LOC114735699 isoform X2 n=1 Tax=Neltuma alba TaxID=207710 RepID=UPI0010A34E54|nr:uncharacterized protein LOC114735699 isoform X2 [Prosopis alba]